MVRYVLTAANALLLCAVVVLGIGAYRTVMDNATSPVASGAATSAPPRPAPEKTPRPAGDVRAITARNLFNTDNGDMSPAASALQMAALAPTRLPLKLLGTVTDDAALSTAVIEDSKQRRQQLYRVGDPIQNAVVRLIEADRVVLTVEGRNEVLEMAAPLARGGAPSAPRITATPPEADASQRPRPLVIPRTLIAQAAAGADALAAGIAMAPGMDGDAVIGIQLNTIQPSSVFRRLGFQNGDILTAINEQALAGPEDVLRLLETLAETDTATITLRRRNRDQSIQYTIR
ncbi:MAG: type II secretion system protein N [Pseudomonadota bacterium]